MKAKILADFQICISVPLSLCFEETIGFYVKATFTSRPLSRLIRWYNKPGDDMTKEFWEKAIQFHGTFHGLKITNRARTRGLGKLETSLVSKMWFLRIKTKDYRFQQPCSYVELVST